MSSFGARGKIALSFANVNDICSLLLRESQAAFRQIPAFAPQAHTVKLHASSVPGLNREFWGRGQGNTNRIKEEKMALGERFPDSRSPLSPLG